MIVEFSVKNFRSIKELQTISFVATGLKSSDAHTHADQNNITNVGGMRLLKTVGIYGPNGSGKSNMIRAIEYFFNAITREPSSASNFNFLCDPFLFQQDASTSASFFQVVLIINGRKYRYGFTIKKNHNNSKNGSGEVITNEWLYGTKEKNSGAYFIRKGMELDKEKLPNGSKIPALPYEHALFITHAAAFDSEGICAEIRNFLSRCVFSNFTGGVEPFRLASLIEMGKEKNKKNLLTLLSAFDLNYDDIILEKDSNQHSSLLPSQDRIFLLKSFEDGKVVRLNLSHHESAGTQKLFDIAGLLLRGFNSAMGGLIILDEVDSNFHPSLLIKLIWLFNDPQLNKSNLQLLFTSHDTNLLSPSIMRRDQFYFTEKQENNSTRVYSLADLKGIRNDADFAKQYLMGFYGALPVLDNFSNSITSDNNGGALEP